MKHRYFYFGHIFGHIVDVRAFEIQVGIKIKYWILHDMDSINKFSKFFICCGVR